MPECYIRGNTIKYLRIPEDVMNLVISRNSSVEDKPEEKDVKNGESSDEEDLLEETVSNENTTIVRLKQLFYDIAYYMNESLGQAKYLSEGESSSTKSVHFEMTGFSDRLIGKPYNMLILIHDRNPKLPLDAVAKNTRDAVSYNMGIDIGLSKEFGTMAKISLSGIGIKEPLCATQFSVSSCGAGIL